MLAKNEDLFSMELHSLSAFKVKGYSKPIQVVRVADGWIYYIFDSTVFVPDQNINIYREEN
jgi:hypothetical protein